MVLWSPPTISTKASTLMKIYYLESCTDESGYVMPGRAVVKKLENCWDNSLWKNKELLSDGWCSE